MLGYCSEVDNYFKIKDCGFDFIEIKAEQLKFIDKNCKVYAVNNIIPRTLKLFGEKNDKTKIKQKIIEIIELAKLRNIKIITFGVGKCRIVDHPINKKEFADFLSFIDKLLQGTEIILGIEPLCKQETNFINTIKDAMEIINSGSFNHIGITLDIYHFRQEKDSFQDIKRYIKHIVHVHLSDQNRDYIYEFDDYFKKFLYTLKINGYNGHFSLELDWKKQFKIDKNLVKNFTELYYDK